MSSKILAYLQKSERLIAGIMSGTSLDGVDVAFVRVGGTGADLTWEFVGFHFEPYVAEMKARLLAASNGSLLARDVFELDVELGLLYSTAIRKAASECGIELSGIDAVGLHGQTIYHAPNRKPVGVTVQIGSAAVVAEELRTIVVNDFRSNDVAAGGQGAPLVPYCDYALLQSRDVVRVALNIGGIANLTWLPKDASPENLLAFDTGPGNMLIDAAMRLLRNVEYDANGEFAASGTPNNAWIEELMREPFFAQQPPKSCGRELFGEERAREWVAEAKTRTIDDASIVASLTLLTARSIAEAVRQCAGKDSDSVELIVGGGGVRNAILMQMLSSELPGARIVPSDEYGLPSDAKEAICFAILANETLCGTPANVPSVTGAKREVVCGAVRVG